MLAVLATLIAGVATASCGAADEDAAETAAPVDAPSVAAEISPYAGTGSPQFEGDGGPAAEAGFYAPQDLSLDAQGNLFIVTDNRIRKVDAATGIITTVAGTGRNKFSGDGGPATEATLSVPMGVAIDASGNLYIATHASFRVRKIDASTGIITTLAGGAIRESRTSVEIGDGGPATEAYVREPTNVAVDDLANVYVVAENRVRKIDASSGVISTFAGTGLRGVGGDGGPATAGEFAEPRGIAVDVQGNVFIADKENHRVRRVDGTTGVLTTLAGIGVHVTCRYASGGGGCVDIYRPTEGAGYSGDGGPANTAELSQPTSVAVDAQGNVFITEGKVRVRKVDTTGVISTFASGEITDLSVGGRAQVRTEAVGDIVSIVRNDNGLLFLADIKNNRIHQVSSPASSAP